MQLPTDYSRVELQHIELFRWLTGDGAQELLKLIAEWRSLGFSVLKIAERLRARQLDQEIVRCLLKQDELRKVASRKFARADQMFFQQPLLQQATDERLACFKARRFLSAPAVVDYCCGIGGDLLGLSHVSSVIGVDRNPVACLLASANCRAHGQNVEILECSVETASIGNQAWFHIDPDRRSSQRRTSDINRFSPNLETIERLVGASPSGAIKVAPATVVPDHWLAGAERQWIGDRRECKQQVIWFGGAARHENRRTAAAIDTSGSAIFELVETAEAESPALLANEIGTFLYEPHPTIIAAGLVDEVAGRFDLRKTALGIPYLIGGDQIDFAGLSRFRILDVVRVNATSIREGLSANDCGNLEIKKRGVDHSLLAKFSRLKLTGTKSLTLILTRFQDRHVALVCTRT